MQNIDQAEYTYTIPESAEDSIIDFLGDAILLSVEYYFTDCRSDGDDDAIKDTFVHIKELWHIYDALKNGNFELQSYHEIDLLYSAIELNIFEQIKKYDDVDNPRYFYEIMRVWKDLDEIWRDYHKAKRGEYMYETY